ncbi:hypothetical protein GM418_30180 [Maribellus comscasis]|uniref:TerB family tellurite resistance protein n=1 Tax=Maribellus comscasis TaxID=2681766 RepID=A0A6I6K2V4_9BACT|nr:hypothetical protein [Maribellus comscasis]QGY47778.1 hypothetical protein GM418_30180 [Maribellus comscasis]
MKKKIILSFAILLTLTINTSNAQTPVTDVGAGIQREALWVQEEGILSKINLYNVLIKALNGDIKGLTGEILGIDKEMLESLQKVSYLIKDYKRIQETKDILQKIITIYTDKVPLLVQDGNFTTQQAAAIVQSFDIILDDSKSLVTSILNIIVKDDFFMMDDKQRYDAINGIYLSVKRHYGTICYLHNKIMYASYMKSRNDNTLEGFAMYYSLYK